MPRLLLSVSPLALLAAAGFHALTLVGAEAADCTIDTYSEQMNGNGGVGECDPLSFVEGDTLTLKDTGQPGNDPDLLVDQQRTGGLRVGSDSNEINGVRIINYGKINLRADTARQAAIEYYGDSGKIYNFGTLDVTNPVYENGQIGPTRTGGIRYVGDDALVENHGTIKTIGSQPLGLILEGDHGKATNFGHIETSGTEGIGMGATGDYAHVINGTNAVIDVLSVEHGRGIAVNGEYVRAENYGKIKGRGDLFYGIFPRFDHATAVNYGTIEGIGGYFHGFFLRDNYGSAENYGRITWTHSSGGYPGIGMFSRGPLTWMSNYGNIEMTRIGEHANLDPDIGMWIGDWDGFEVCDPANPGPNCQKDKIGGLKNFGSISISSIKGHGMHGDDYGLTIVNEGSITTHGSNSRGIFLHGAGKLTIENSGLIKVADLEENQKSYAIVMGPRGDYEDITSYHITLAKGSVIVGDVGLRRPEAATINFGLGMNAVVNVDANWVGRSSEVKNAEDFKNMLTVNSANGIHAMQDYGVHTADASDYVAQDAVMGELTRAVQSVVSNRLFVQQPQREEGSSAGSTWGKFCQGQWFAPFGGYTKSDGGDTYVGYQGWVTGMATGCALEGGMNAFGGLTYASAEPEDGENFSVQSFGAFAGLHGDLPDMNIDLDIAYAVTLGYANQTHERQVTDSRDKIDGIVDYQDDYASLYLTPSLAMKLPDVGLGEFDLQLSYTGIWYSEHEFGADLSVDESFSNAVSAQLTHSIALDNGNVFSVGGGATWQQRMDTGLTLAGTSFDVEDPRDAGEAIMGQAFFSYSAPTGLWNRVAVAIGQDDQFSVSVNAGMRF